MNLLQFKYAKAVATYGSFSRSAKACNVSQPTVSNAISDLEQELGVYLFRRSTRCVEPTAFGLSVMKHIDIIMDLVGNIENEAESQLKPQQKSLTIAFSPIVDGPRIMDKFKPFNTQIQDCNFVYLECPTQDLESHLLDEKVDIICGTQLSDERAYGRSVIYHDFLRFIPPGSIKKNSPSQLSISLQEVAKNQLILTHSYCGLTPFIQNLFKRHKLSLIEYQGNPFGYHTVIEWAKENLGAAILPESRIPGDVHQYPIITNKGYPIMVAIEAIWSRSRSVPVHLRKFTQFLNGLSLNGMLNFNFKAL